MSGEITTQWGLLAIVVPAILAAVVALAKIFKARRNGNEKPEKSTDHKVAEVQQAISQLDPKEDTETIKELKTQILILKEEEAEKVKAKTLELAQTIVTLQTELKTAETKIGEISEDLGELIIQTGKDRTSILAMDKQMAIMAAINEYEDKKRKKGGNGGPPIASY